MKLAYTFVFFFQVQYSNTNNSTSSTSCTQNICLNGGTCYRRTSDNQIACQCQRNYLGLRCEQDICRQSALVGPCFASIPRYYYNYKSGQCQLFNYGGCNGKQCYSSKNHKLRSQLLNMTCKIYFKGNENNFGTLDVCNFHCYGH